MITLIVTAIVSFIATNIDYILVLIILFAHLKKRASDGTSEVVSAHFAGLTMILTVSLLLTYGLAFIKGEWIGLIGLIPIIIGIRILLQNSKKDVETIEKTLLASGHKHHKLFFSVLFLGLVLGGDNIGVYVPLFVTLTFFEIVMTVVTYYFLSALILYVSYHVSDLKILNYWILKYEKGLASILLISIGIFTLWESGTVDFLINLF